MTVRLAFGCLASVLCAMTSAIALASTAAAVRCIDTNYVEASGASAREADCLAELRASATRKGELLTLRFDNRQARTWRSNHKACEQERARDCVTYYLAGYHPVARVYWVLAQYYEGASVDIVSAATGQSLHVHGLPYFSSTGSTFVVLDNDFENSSPFEVAVGSTATTPASIVWTYSEKSGARHWDFKKWIGDDQVLVRGIPEGAAGCLRGTCDFTVARSADSWDIIVGVR